jgi:hypothetical protein
MCVAGAYLQKLQPSFDLIQHHMAHNTAHANYYRIISYTWCSIQDTYVSLLHLLHLSHPPTSMAGMYLQRTYQSVWHDVKSDVCWWDHSTRDDLCICIQHTHRRMSLTHAHCCIIISCMMMQHGIFFIPMEIHDFHFKHSQDPHMSAYCRDHSHHTSGPLTSRLWEFTWHRILHHQFSSHIIPLYFRHPFPYSYVTVINSIQAYKQITVLIAHHGHFIMLDFIIL